MEVVAEAIAGRVRRRREQVPVRVDRCPFGLQPRDVVAQHVEAPSQAGAGEHAGFDDVERRVLEEHGGHQRVGFLGQRGGDDGAERVAGDDGGSADHLQQAVGVVDVVDRGGTGRGCGPIVRGPGSRGRSCANPGRCAR